LVSLSQSIERRARVSVETWSPTERLSIEAKEVNPQLVQQRAAQLSVALGLSLRKEREVRA
jgi:Tfp pilus assembly PilM family ATPase